MSAKTRALYSTHLTEQGKRPLEYWPHTSSVASRAAVQSDMTNFSAIDLVRPSPRRRLKPTIPAPAPVCASDLRAMATRMRDDAARWLAQANDLEAAAKRLEGE